MDRFAKIKSRLLAAAEKDPDIKAAILIGSSARSADGADEYSDMDVVIVTENTEEWLYGDYVQRLGEVKISFVEPTLGGGKERRVLYDGSLDADMIIFDPRRFEEVVRDGPASQVMSRGYFVMYDSEKYSELLQRCVSRETVREEMTEGEFINTVNDFFFHTVWAAKKILRGELWTAKMCVDAYLKYRLLAVIEMYSALKYGADVWHDGRFLDKWAEREISEELKGCFGRYDKENTAAALLLTAKLFGRLAEKAAEMKKYAYPKEAENYADELLKTYFK